MKSIVLTALAATLAFNLNAAENLDIEAAKAAREEAAKVEAAKKLVKPKEAALLGVDAGTVSSMKHRAQIINATRKTQDKPSNLVGRKAKASMRDRVEKYRVALAESEKEAIMTRSVRKAAKRSQKNLGKILKAIDQGIKKASDDEEREFYTELRLLITGEND